MPCDSIQRSKVEFLPTSTNLDLLEQALTVLGLYVRRPSGDQSLLGSWGFYDATTGRLELRTRDVDVDMIKRAYSKQAVDQQAKRYGWQLSWARNEDGNEVASVQKRRF